MVHADNVTEGIMKALAEPEGKSDSEGMKALRTINIARSFRKVLTSRVEGSKFVAVDPGQPSAQARKYEEYRRRTCTQSQTCKYLMVYLAVRSRNCTGGCKLH